MLKKISSLKDIQALEKGDILFDKYDLEKAKAYKVNAKLTDDLIVDHQNGIIETRLLTRKDLLNNGWWVKK